MAFKYFTFVWRIENFIYYCQKANQFEIISPEFHLNFSTGQTKWRFLFTDKMILDSRDGNRNYRAAENDKVVKLYLQRTDDNRQDFSDMKINLSFVNNDKSVYNWSDGQIFGKGTPVKEILTSTFKKFLRYFTLFLTDALVIRCKIEHRETTLNLIEEQCFVQTLLAVKRMYFVAVIEEFSDLIPGLKRSICLKSASVDQPIFSLNVCLSDEGKLNICIPVETNYIYICFCKVLVLENSGNWLQCGQDTEWRKFGEVCEFPLTLDFKTLMDKHKYLQNDMVTLKCEVTYSTEAEPQRIETIRYGLESTKILQQIPHSIKTPAASETENGSLLSLSTLTEDLVSLYKEGTLCDTKLRTEAETFPAHKAVLSARSPVFKKMFTTDMKENTSDYVDIQDLNADTVHKLLVFIYTDTVDLMDWQNAKELYFASDKYEISSLKLKCSSFLKLNIRPSNCCDVLLLSDMHQDMDLKRFVQEYIITRDQDVFGSDEWRNFVANHIQLAADTMCLKYARK